MSEATHTHTISLPAGTLSVGHLFDCYHPEGLTMTAEEIQAKVVADEAAIASGLNEAFKIATSIGLFKNTDTAAVSTALAKVTADVTAAIPLGFDLVASFKAVIVAFKTPAPVAAAVVPVAAAVQPVAVVQ